jgi:hypothetical protein
LISQNEQGGYNPVGATPGPGGPPNFATGANRAGMDWRQMRRDAVADGTYTPPAPDPADPTGANRAGYGWRDDRRQAMQQGLIAPNAAGGFSPTGPASGMTGANRAGMDWRAQRRQAMAAGQYPGSLNSRPGKGGQPA